MVFVSIVLVLALAEIAVRVLGPEDRDRGRSIFIMPVDQPDLDYVLEPGAERGGRVPIRINSNGFRDREFTPHKPEGIRRIIVIGDSVVFGLGVQAEETFAKQLESRLEGATPPTEVLNLGVGGFDVVNEVAFLEKVGLDFDPDIVVLGLCINDVGIHSSNARTLRWLQPVGWITDHSSLVRFALGRVNRTEQTQDFHRLNEDVAFRRLNEGRIDSLTGDADQRARMQRLALDLAQIDSTPPFAAWYTSPDKVGRLRHAFGRLAELSRERSFEVWIAVIPYLDEGGAAEIYQQVYAITGHEADRAGFGVVQLREAFAIHGMVDLRRRTRQSEDPLHPNAEGHRLIAEVLERSLAGARSGGSKAGPRSARPRVLR